MVHAGQRTRLWYARARALRLNSAGLRIVASLEVKWAAESALDRTKQRPAESPIYAGPESAPQRGDSDAPSATLASEYRAFKAKESAPDAMESSPCGIGTGETSSAAATANLRDGVPAH
jgi:hypothetical protein